MIYEIRTYIPHKGQAEAMQRRFIEQVAATFFPKHGIELVGVLTPTDKLDERLIYMTRFSDESAREAAWKAFSSDPDWQEVKRASETNGPLLESQQISILTPAIAGALLS